MKEEITVTIESFKPYDPWWNKIPILRKVIRNYQTRNWPKQINTEGEVELKPSNIERLTKVYQEKDQDENK